MLRITNDEIVEYIRSSLEKGYDIEGIKSSLRQSGWPEYEIESSVAAVQSVNTKPQDQPLKTTGGQEQPVKKVVSKKLIIAVVVLIIIVILFLYVAVKIVTDFKTMFPGGGSIIPGNIPFVS